MEFAKVALNRIADIVPQQARVWNAKTVIDFQEAAVPNVPLFAILVITKIIGVRNALQEMLSKKKLLFQEGILMVVELNLLAILAKGQ